MADAGKEELPNGGVQPASNRSATGLPNRSPSGLTGRSAGGPAGGSSSGPRDPELGGAADRFSMEQTREGSPVAVECDYRELPGDDAKGWEKVTVSEAVRMKLNGESKEQMAHARAIKAAGGVSLPESFSPSVSQERRCDTSKDQDWPLDESRCAQLTDQYVLITTVLWLGPKITLFTIPMLLAAAPPMAIVRLYMSVLPDGTNRVNRSGCFYFIFAITFTLGIPALALAILSYILDMIMYYVFSLLFCVFTWRWQQAFEGRERIKPFRNGPSVIQHMPDLFVALVGQTSRQTIFETTYMVACMLLLMPWLKYYINCNPWVYDLGYRLCQQISTEMADLKGAENVADKARYIISCTREDRSTAERIDIWSFVPHYPFPPPDRRWALGLQAGGSAYPGKFTLVVHTTHAIQEVRGCTEQFVLSNSVELPIYRVMLWYNNPFHFLTGWVEASVSNGKPSQLNKAMGGEHPMWLVTGRTRQVAGRDSWTGSGMIDAFFDYWLPVFVHEMRRQVLGKAEADRKYQEVNSKDGISSPKLITGMDKYNAEGARTAMDDYQEEAAKQRKAEAQPIGRYVARLADTEVGKGVAGLLQGSDLHAQGGLLEGCSSISYAASEKDFGRS